MADPFLGQLLLVGFNFEPTNWMFAQGQILPLQRYTALFSLFGTQFGGERHQHFRAAEPARKYQQRPGAGSGAEQLHHGRNRRKPDGHSAGYPESFA